MVVTSSIWTSKF